MKALVIPDVHLKPYMFKEAAEWMRKGVADRAVCLMDIPDDWNREYDIELYAQTFDAAISFAKEFPDTLWCYGNHDLCYLWNERESGYSRAAAYTVRNKLEELKEALPAGNQIRYIQRIDDVLFCHGGILQAFVEENVKNTDSVDQTIAEIWDRSSYGAVPAPSGTARSIIRRQCMKKTAFYRLLDIHRWRKYTEAPM